MNLQKELVDKNIKLTTENHHLEQELKRIQKSLEHLCKDRDDYFRRLKIDERDVVSYAKAWLAKQKAVEVNPTEAVDLENKIFTINEGTTNNEEQVTSILPTTKAQGVFDFCAVVAVDGEDSGKTFYGSTIEEVETDADEYSIELSRKNRGQTVSVEIYELCPAWKYRKTVLHSVG
jgi:hypothetical protein